MTINIKNFLNDKTKLSKMGEFQSLKQIEGLEMASISADLYKDGRDDLALFYFTKGANYATLTTSNSITSESAIDIHHFSLLNLSITGSLIMPPFSSIIGQ